MPHDPARSCDLFFPFEKTVMQPIQEQFIEFALEADVLRFGEFKTKAGRLSPYFFNAGLFNTGALLDRLGEFYAKTLLAARDAGRIEFDMIFGPAYKGIPLAASVAMNLSRLSCDVPWAFNRKEAKDHVIVGAPLKGKVVIIDDVISAGTSVRESVKIIQANGAVPSGVLIALDRQERGGNAVEMTETSAVQDVEKTLGMNVASIICLNDLLAFMNGHGHGQGRLLPQGSRGRLPCPLRRLRGTLNSVGPEARQQKRKRQMTLPFFICRSGELIRRRASCEGVR